jgi:hypothetical protein
MALKLIVPALLLFCVSQNTNAQSARSSKDLPRFMGREVTITEPETDADGFLPKGPASICIQGPPERQCYTAPNDFGLAPGVTLLQVGKGMPALLFSANSGGVSGWRIHFALLRPGTGPILEDLFLSDTSVSNQSQHAFWNDPAISEAPIFVTADYILGPDESHYSDHRYIISAYVLKSSSLLNGHYYYLEDRYMTAREYVSDIHTDILGSEKQEILARLGRLKAETDPRQQAPR